jgi:YHS domain-containing protein
MTAKDPVCGMEVDERKSPKSVYKGKPYYFCSKACKMEFDGNPGKFVKG